MDHASLTRLPEYHGDTPPAFIRISRAEDRRDAPLIAAGLMAICIHRRDWILEGMSKAYPEEEACYHWEAHCDSAAGLLTYAIGLIQHAEHHGLKFYLGPAAWAFHKAMELAYWSRSLPPSEWRTEGIRVADNTLMGLLVDED